ncbi:hypothetical protein ACVIIV_005771 [Bradyrhizobium sp. USDA 4354]
MGQQFASVPAHPAGVQLAYAPGVQSGSATRNRREEAWEHEADAKSSALLHAPPPQPARPGFDLSDVRVHADLQANRSAEQVGALAYTAGHHVVFNSGQYRPDTQSGKALLAHELVHVAQQTSAPTTLIQAKGKAEQVITITKITIYVDRDLVVLELDGKSTLVLPLVYNGRPAPGVYQVTNLKADPPLGGTANENHYIAEWVPPPGAKYKKSYTYIVHVVQGRPGAGKGAAAGASGVGGGKGSGATEGAGKSEKEGASAQKGEGSGGKAESAGGGGSDGIGAAEGKTGGKGTAGGAQSGGGPRLTPEEEVIWRQLAEMMHGSDPASREDPAELVHLFQTLREVVVDPQFSTEGGRSWVRFAQFLDQNRDKIEGTLKSGPGGKVTEEVIAKVIAQYEKFIASVPEPESPGQLETQEDFEKEFKYEPGWRHISPADRKLMVEFAKMSPDEGKKADYARVTTEMKLSMALKVADTSFLGAVAEAAKNAFTDPKFVITLIVIMAIYVGLWLTPDPSWITKIAAGALTVALLAQFAIEDIYGFAVAWSDFNDDCRRATTIEGLKAAGDKFLKKAGQVGFDIMLFLVMWRVGKLAGPKLAKIGAERGVARAEAGVRAAEAEPGSGVAKSGGATAGELLSKAKSTSQGTTPTQVLDALAKMLPESAQKGLAQFRAKAGDTAAYRAVEGQAARGGDLGRYLTEQGMTAEAKASAARDLAQAQLKLARAKLIQAETIKDPALRETVRAEQYEAIKSILKQAGALDGAEIKQALAARDPQALMRALRKAISELGEKVSSHKTQGALGEAVQRAQLRMRYAGQKTVQFISSLQVVRVVGQYKSIRDWTKAEEARIRQEKPNITDAELNKEVSKTRVKLFEKDGAVWESLGEVDTMVAEPGANGKLKPLEITEVKAGSTKGGTDAARQLGKIVDLFGAIAGGDPNVRLYEQKGPQQLGKDLTSSFDLSQARSILQTTFGPEGRTGFSESLGYTEADLKGVADSLLKNLPPEKPARVAPVTSPDPKEREPEPAH